LGVVSTGISRLRERYKPERIEVLFVAESPPESSDDEVRFFYNSKQERWNHMYRAVMKAVFPEFEYCPGEKDNWLRKFKQHGYYLIDATDRPVNRVTSAERRYELDAAVKPKLSEIKRLVSPSTPIVLVKKNIFSAFNRPLRDAGYNVIHESFLPFPSHGHQKDFVIMCRDCLRKAKRDG
jgi:hypothetical protein